jgi:hypothetical protein
VASTCAFASPRSRNTGPAGGATALSSSARWWSTRSPAKGEGALIRGKWLRHARLRLKSGRVPFEPGEPPQMPSSLPHGPAAKTSAVGSPPSIPSGPRAPAARRGARRRQAATPRRIVIPATTLAEFLAVAVARYGSIRRAAAGIGIPYSTLRGWLRGRYGDAGDRGVRAPMP